MPEILSGIRVVGLTSFVAMPGACCILGDWGAEVITIEHPKGGDPQRRWVPQNIDGPACPANPQWEHDRRNQKSLALDLSKEKGKEAAYRLIKTSDVFVSNIPANALAKLGMDYEPLKQINPRLIYAHFTGYGTKGPDRDKPGFDHSAFWASSGLQGTVGDADGPPPRQRPGVGDHIASIAGAAGVVAALFARERYGVGQRVDSCLLAVGMWANSIDIATCLMSGKDIPRTYRRKLANPFRNVYRCSDDRWLQLVMPVDTDRYWPGLCRVLGIERLEHDPRFKNEPKRIENCEELISILDKAFASKDFAHCKEALDKWGLIWAPINRTIDIANSPQAEANDFIREVNHSSLGKVKVVATPWTFSETPASIRLSAPTLGQNTDEVLRDIGYAAVEIGQLRRESVIL